MFNIEKIKEVISRSDTILVMFGINLFSLYAIYKIYQSSAIEQWFIFTLIGYVLIQMLGINAGYHRLLAHKSFETRSIVKKILLFFAMMAGQGSPIFWCAIHRSHHIHTDTIKDIHAPINGFWNSYILWMFRFKSSDIHIRHVTDLLKDRDCLFVHKHYNKLFFVTHIVLAMISFDLWIFGIVLPIFITLHCSAFQTSFTHMKKIGYQNFKLENTSSNVPIVFPLILGEAWHNNHHGNPKNSNFGIKWWELDPTYWLIMLIRKK
jgi:fatty-acid desaturase